MFAMLFGAGNVVFPLALGCEVGSSAVWFALAGFCLTACLVPLVGIVSTMLYDGDYRKFLGTMGKIPATLVALICMVLIGPFGCIPRCVAISHAAVSWYMPSLSLWMFSILAGLIIFVFTVRKSSIMDVLGRFLGPIKLTLLLAIIAFGLLYPSTDILSGSMQPFSAFAKGLMEGYGTMDLLGAIFFAGLICGALRKGQTEAEDSASLAKMGLKAGLIGASLLGLVYAGFCLVAAQYAAQLQGVDKGQLLSALNLNELKDERRNERLQRHISHRRDTTLTGIKSYTAPPIDSNLYHLITVDRVALIIKRKYADLIQQPKLKELKRAYEQAQREYLAEAAEHTLSGLTRTQIEYLDLVNILPITIKEAVNSLPPSAAYKVVCVLLAAGADIKERGYLLPRAIQVTNNPEGLLLVERLRTSVASLEMLDQNDPWKETALLKAARLGCYDMAKALIVAGANVDAADMHGNTLRRYAKSDSKLAQAIVEARQDPNCKQPKYRPCTSCIVC